ncbi:MAG: hypothetical protein GX102_15410 [Porphyromonadaceae bacterium]|jgi:hypothetical protein|nr:hypothetical protein [Porphyromonadaceae bacterium]
MSDIKNIRFHDSLRDIAVFVRCTYAQAYLHSDNKRRNVVRSYNKNALKKIITDDRGVGSKGGTYLNKYFDLNLLDREGFSYGVSESQIAVLTGEYFFDKNICKLHTGEPFVFLRARLLYCDRTDYGWFRSTDINPDVTSDFLPKNYSQNNVESKTNWLWWLTAGLMALRGF